MIKFNVIRWKNLLSSGNTFTEVDLSSNPTTLIVGHNGAGKSTILDALSFVLFGKPFRKINKPQLVNTINQKNLVVEIEFSINATEYKIIRGIKPTVFEVYKNGSLLNQSAESKDYQEILETQILKVNHKSFCQVVILGSATFQPFMQLPAGQRREIIEDLLDLQIFTTMNSLLKDKVSENNDNIGDVNSDKRVIESKIDMTKEHMVEIQNNNEKIIEEKKQLINESDSQILELTDKINFISDNVEAMKSEIGDSQDALKKKMDKLTKLRHQIEAKIKLINEDIKFFADNAICPTCKQDINEKFRQTTIENNKQEIKVRKDALTALVTEHKELQERLNDILKKNEDIMRQEMKKHEMSVTVRSLNNYKNQLQNDISKIHNVHQEQADNKLADYEKELKDLEVRYNDLVEEKHILMAAGTMLKDSGIKSKIIKQYIPVINKLINKYLSSMDFFVSFELNEQFEETIKSRYRDTFTYSSFSEGEKQKIDLALLFTWRAIAKLRNSINTNLLIMDEVFDSSLDQNSTDYLMNIIREVANDNNIIIISHKEQMNERFSNVMKFTKTKSFSQLQK